MSAFLEITIANENELDVVAKKLLNFFDKNKLVFFNAPMGAGKTTLIKALCKALGCNDNLSSPTYSIVNEYRYPNGKIFHFDLYRLKNQEELLDIGIEEYLYSGNYCFFEWPDLIESLVEINYYKVEIAVKENIRYLRVTQN